MTNSFKTPGVYITEKDAFHNSVVGVATAVPAFVGYTQKADHNGKLLTYVPWRISSLAEYEAYFGKAPGYRFTIADAGSTDADMVIAGKGYRLIPNQDTNFLLYHSIKLFFLNGGGPCYIVSAGSYEQGTVELQSNLIKGIDTLRKEQEPTMLVVPDAMLLRETGCAEVQKHMLDHCMVMKNRIAILDVYDGSKARTRDDKDVITRLRNTITTPNAYAAAYYPWVNTSIVKQQETGYQHISNTDKLKEILNTEAGLVADDKRKQSIQAELGKLDNATNDPAQLNKALLAISPAFKTLTDAICTKLNLLPPAAAMAGIYTLVDNRRGVWKAPANVSLNAVISPAVTISHYDQDDLNVPPDGKSINAIRSFVGEGVLVWGARTLDGNSADWRYINVRRTAIYLEESIRLAAKAYVFEPNVANTWVAVRSMISNFLTQAWKQGALAGSTPEEAFSVQIGLGATMTAEDILEGIMRITVQVAISRPAEFIEITLQQQMQQS
jgi:phage tail sheath protein FI